LYSANILRETGGWVASGPQKQTENSVSSGTVIG